MMGPCPAHRHASIKNAMETTGDKEYAHVDVNHESANGNQGCHAVEKHNDRHKPMGPGGDTFREPHEQACNQQHEGAVIHDPVELLLAGVELSCRRNLVITVGDVGFHVLVPLTV